ncbi:uncharacterized protein lgals4 isoform X4 [Astyanax mexicanus]|uniref:uncharacterized protein lgals4 isoform X4 n=1 Tax=Astyanax mexicanus TaxID=7994 RepID=UPI0020CAA5A3|nr:uncharacterized protein lgals4 isoform X4 [Astyanax mexicanus]
MRRGHHHGEHRSHHGDRQSSRSEHRSECSSHSEQHSHRGSHGEHHFHHGSREEHHSHHGSREEHHSHHGLLSGLHLPKVIELKTPYVCPVPGGLIPGKALFFQGVLPLAAKTFEINLKTGQSSADDVAFHFKLLSGQKVVLNSFRNGKWESEEPASDKLFIKLIPFFMWVVTKAEGYEVYVNGSQHCFFKHRMPLEKVSAVEIRGDVIMNVFNFVDNWSISSLLSMGQKPTTASEISFSVNNPKIPYVGPISGGIKPGMAVYLQGVVPQTANQFEINLKTGQSAGDDIAFHFKPQIGQKVSLNSFKKGAWENEESVSDKPFAKGGAFTIIFVIKADVYEVYVNGFQHCTFKHRMSVERVSAIDIRGDVNINMFGFIQNWSTCSFFKEQKPVPATHSEIAHAVSNAKLPYMGPISVGMRPGMALYFQGLVLQEAKQFEINLKTGQSGGDDTAFQFKPCFGQKVTLNSFSSKSWQIEESASDKPFTKGAAFTMIFVIKAEGFEVYVNGLQLCMFKHRLPLEKVTALMISGDVSMNIFGVIPNWHTSSFFMSNFQSEMALPVLKPEIPLVRPLSGGMKPGMALCFQGVVPVDAKEFAVNLQTGPSNEDDKALHFKPCIGQKVTLNSFRNGKWESEESASVEPFTSGAPFTMFFVTTPQGYEVYVNGFQHCLFKHRVPLEKVTTLIIRGDVSVNLLGTIDNWHTSSFFLCNFQSEMVQSVLKPVMPYTSPLSGGISPGMALCFQGTVASNAKDFTINLQSGPSNSDDRAFHFNPRMGQRVAMNSFRKGKWESEESASVGPFTKGAAFTVFFVVTTQGYEVYVNGLRHCMFKHRFPLEKIDTLVVFGDVSLNIFGLIKNWETSSDFLSSSQTEITQQVLKPAIPCVRPITDGLKPGMALCFQGVVPENAKEFAVNLQTGPSNEDDKALHFKPCIGQKVTLNSFRNGKWESEESASVEPFTSGAPFTMFFVTTPQGYEVIVNGLQHCMFKHRVPLEKVSALTIRGDVSMNMLGLIKNWKTSSVFLSRFQSEMVQPVLKPAIPCVRPITDGLKPGMALCFQGVVPENAKEFEVNLQTGPSNDQDKALHFKPCIGQKVTLSSFRNGKWESEESASVEPFTSGAPFTMFFVTTPQGYEVYVNGFQHCMFKHRIPLEKINSLIIRGDVSANMIGMIKNWHTSSFSLSNFQSEMIQPVLKPAIPCVRPITDALKPGMALCFQGVVPENAKEFEVNLQTGPSNEDDNALHFKPCIGQKVTLNSFRNGKWESEESASVGPFTSGAPFTMFFVTTPQGYEVIVNGLQHCMFKHRVPLEKVSALTIRGDVSMNMLGLIKNWKTSSVFLSRFQSEMVQPVLKPAIPCVRPITDGLKPGMALCFQGVVPENAKEFEVNLQTGPSNDQDKALHFKPCIGQKVTLNSFRNGKWESEESASVEPFTSGAPFTMFFVTTPQGYEVYVNGFQHCMFKHRIPLEKINSLIIRGDVSANMIGMIKNWHTSSFSLSNFQSEMIQPVLKPAIPCVRPITDGLKPGMALCFQGVVPENAKEFAVNLQTGPSNEDDKALHFKPCIGQKVTLSSFRNGKWESEESASVGPFTSGAPFTMFFVTTPQGYEVIVNGLQHCMFKHRVPLEKVSALTIRGDVSMNMLGLIKNWHTSSFSLSNFQSEMVQPLLKPAIPCVRPITDGLKPGMALCFQGVVPENAKEFAVNLQTGPSNEDDKALHFKPCIGQKVTLNSFRNGKWESEESASVEPFTSGAPFTMFFVTTPQGYEVIVNGLQHCMFKHRVPLEKVSALTIRGDVSMNMLGLIKNWKTSSVFLSRFQSEMVQPVLKPAIPCVRPITEGLKPGMALCFQGVVPENAKEFEVNLQTGPSNDQDKALHFKPCIGQKVTLSSFRNGKWESEESASVEPFTGGAPFTMFFVTTPQGYEVIVNGLQHCMFKHRVPLEKVSALTIRGDVSMNMLGLIKNWHTSSFSLSNFQSEMVQPLLKPAIPCVRPITDGLKPGMALCFQGVVPENAKEFEVNLQTGPSNDQDKALHFKPCIGQKVTLNSFRNGKWESEESASVEPFTSGAPFTMFFAINTEGYEVFVNGVKHCMFKHRIPVEKVSTLNIGGDVSINMLGYINKWKSSSFFTKLNISGAGSSTCTVKPIQIDVSHPVNNPAIPYVGTIPEGIKPDMAVCFQGTVPADSDQFAINFKTGSSDGDDVALHFNPLIGQKVTLNSFRNGKWESEESASAEPFTRGAPFTMFFAINTEGYEVFVNGVKHCMFKHRIPVEKVSTLNIGGDVSLNMIGYINKWSSCSFFKEQQKISGRQISSQTSTPIQIDVSHPVANPAIPYVGTIPEGIKPDMAVCFQGTVPADSDQFAINFKTGSSDGDDVALHFNPRIGQKVTLNSFRNGKWESEESASAEPFTKGAPFTMFFAINTEGYEVFVNGVKHCMFKHRIPVEKVSTLNIGGDVSMNMIGYINKWSSCSFIKKQQKISGMQISSQSTKPIQIDVSHPVANPAIPYVGTIPEGIKPDMAVCFQGTVPADSDQFAINFKTGSSDGDDVALHFKPLIGQKVTLNSFRNGKWESEESASAEPFTSGAPFTMFFAINTEGYEVFVNGVKHCMFKHRIPVEKVSTLNIRGDVSLNMIGYINKWSSCSFFKEQQKISGRQISSQTSKPIQIDVSHPVVNPAIPYVGTIPEGIKPDMAVCFQGTVPADSDQFAINFKTGSSDGDDVALHFNPLIGQKVTLSSFRNGKWESEESASAEPFTKGAPFTMFFAINTEGYEVFVNGVKHCMFKHRIPVEKVSTLNIGGDVSLNMIGYINKWSSCSFFKEQQKISGRQISSQTSTPIQIDVSHPVVNPAIPYVGTIPEGIKPDMAVCFQGTVPADSDQFAINFKTGSSDGDDVALHFNPRIGQKVTLNSFRNGKWESEESASAEPFTKGAPFTMFFTINTEGYEVFVNGVKHCMFKHRIPVEKVSTLNIGGDVSLNMIGYINKWSSCSFFKELQKISGLQISSQSSTPIQIDVSHPVVNPAIPYVGTIPEGIKPDMAVCFQGTVPADSDQFAINFKTGSSDGDDVALHFKPCIGQKVTLNSFRNGKWESEESASAEPFTKGAPFTMFFTINTEGYEVFVNGVKHCMFKHRIPVEKVSTLNIGGDVSLNMIGYINKWSSCSFFKELQKISGRQISSQTSTPIQIDVSHPVVNPAIPYVGTIPEGIKPDMAVCFQGTVPADSDQFAINFKTGSSDGDDVALHFNPLIGQKVTLSSCRNGKWESEESASAEPFTKGAPFTMFFTINTEGYEVFVNGVKHCMFKHRIPVEKVSTLNIGGDVSMNMIGYINKWSSCSFFKEQQKISGLQISSQSSTPIQIDVSHPVVNPAIPYVGTIPEGIKPDMAVCFQGTVPADSDQFAINFKTGSSDGDDVALHFNPRIGQKVTLNSFRNGKWESEESASAEPFTRGAPFTMFFAINTEGYEVFVNGVKHCMFKHRIPVEKVSTLNIDGNVSLNMIGYINKWSSCSFVMEQQKISGVESSSSSLIELELSHPVTNPAIPYVGTIPEGIKPDMAVCFQGTVPADSDQFSINFKTGSSDGDDVALHFNPLIGQKVTLSSCRNGKWESEESASAEPFTKGAPFTMFVIISAEGYEVNVNGMELCKFKHRVPLEKVSVLNIAGGVTIDMVGFVMNWSKAAVFEESEMVVM